jgi:hypothetical protein
LVLMVGYLAYKCTLRHRSNASRSEKENAQNPKHSLSVEGPAEKSVCL